MSAHSNIHIRAILVGIAAEVVLGLLIGPLEALLLFGSSLSGLPLHVGSLVFGSLATMFAAYLTAYNSPTNKLLNVLIFWGINEMLGFLSLFFSTLPLWYDVVGTITVALSSLLGWYLEGQMHKSA